MGESERRKSLPKIAESERRKSLSKIADSEDEDKDISAEIDSVLEKHRDSIKLSDGNVGNIRQDLVNSLKSFKRKAVARRPRGTPRGRYRGRARARARGRGYRGYRPRYPRRRYDAQDYDFDSPPNSPSRSSNRSPDYGSSRRSSKSEEDSPRSLHRSRSLTGSQSSSVTSLSSSRSIQQTPVTSYSPRPSNDHRHHHHSTRMRSRSSRSSQVPSSSSMKTSQPPIKYINHSSQSSMGTKTIVLITVIGALAVLMVIKYLSS